MTIDFKKKVKECRNPDCSIYRGCHYIQLRDK